MSQNLNTNFQQKTNTTRKPTNTTSGFHGKSKYASKKRFQKNKFSAPKPKAGPVNEYPCECHGEAAKKPELVKVRPAPKSPEETKGLGHWRCSVTGKRTKVTVRKAVPKEPLVVVEQ